LINWHNGILLPKYTNGFTKCIIKTPEVVVVFIMHFVELLNERRNKIMRRSTKVL
jgi:phenolic acid decarboxylase